VLRGWCRRQREGTDCCRADSSNGPPEDCGGIPGFYELLEAIADRTHSRHAHLKDRAGDYDPDTFDAVPIKYALSRIANRRNAAKARLAKKKRREQTWLPSAKSSA